MEQTKKMDTVKLATGEGGSQSVAFKSALASSIGAGAYNCISDDFKILSINSARSEETYLEPILRSEKPCSDSALSEKVPSNDFSIYDPPLSPHEVSPYATLHTSVRSVSMRDMGTEMTPLASQEPSRTGTPVRATTPTMSSPVPSWSSMPQKVTAEISPTQEPQFIESDGDNTNLIQLGEKEIHAKSRQEFYTLGTQLGKSNLVSWSSKEEEDEDAFRSLKAIDLEDVKNNMPETRAAAWEEAEKAKSMAGYVREEANIQAWVNHEKAKAEAEMRRTEVKVEKMRSNAHRKLMNKLAAVDRLAEERRVAAETKYNEKTAKAAQNAEYIRRTGRVPSSFFLCHC